MDALDAVLVVVGGLLCWFASLAACEKVTPATSAPGSAGKRHWILLLLKAAILLVGVPLIVSAFLTAPGPFQFVVAIGATWALMELAESLTRGREVRESEPQTGTHESPDSARHHDPLVS